MVVGLFFSYFFHWSLKFFLCISSSNCNLLPVSKISQSHDCFVLFCFSLLIVSYRTSIPIRGLTVIKEEETCTIWMADLSSLLKKHQQLLWVTLCWHQNRKRFGFGLFKRLFPLLFNGYHLSDFVCETCVMAKKYHTIFYSNDNKIDDPFSLVHLDFWGSVVLLHK